MKIECAGYSITDVPGLEKIVIEPSAHDQGVQIVMVDEEGGRQGWGIAELYRYRDAINEALKLSIVMADQIKKNT